MNAFLLKNERKTLIRKFCLLFSQVFGFPLFALVQVEYIGSGLAIASSAVRLSAKKNRLKTRWVPHDICVRIPPQEQGTRSQTPNRTRLIYPLKPSINSVANCRPLFWVDGKHSSAAVSNSMGMSVYKSPSAIQPGKDWLCSSPRNSWNVKSLLSPAYVNNMISRIGAVFFKSIFITVSNMLKQRKVADQQVNRGKWVVYPFGGTEI